MGGIILLFNITQPLHILTVHLLQRRPKYSKVGVTRSILEVLAVLDPGFDNGSAQVAHVIVHVHVPVERFVVPRDKQARWEDGVGPVGRVRRWSPMCKDVGLECIKVEDDQGVLVFLAKFVTQGLYHKSMHGEANETTPQWHTLTPSIAAFTTGAEYCNMGTPSP